MCYRSNLSDYIKKDHDSLLYAANVYPTKWKMYGEESYGRQQALWTVCVLQPQTMLHDFFIYTLHFVGKTIAASNSLFGPLFCCSQRCCCMPRDFPTHDASGSAATCTLCRKKLCSRQQRRLHVFKSSRSRLAACSMQQWNGPKGFHMSQKVFPALYVWKNHAAGNSPSRSSLCFRYRGCRWLHDSSVHMLHFVRKTFAAWSYRGCGMLHCKVHRVWRSHAICNNVTCMF